MQYSSLKGHNKKLIRIYQKYLIVLIHSGHYIESKGSILKDNIIRQISWYKNAFQLAIDGSTLRESNIII